MPRVITRKYFTLRVIYISPRGCEICFPYVVSTYLCLLYKCIWYLNYFMIHLYHLYHLLIYFSLLNINVTNNKQYAENDF